MDTAIGIMDRVQREWWRPILTGSLADRAWHAIDAIARDPAMHPAGETRPSSGDGTLATGRAGLAMFYTYLSLVRHRDANRKAGLAHLYAALQALEQSRLPPGLFEGFTGIGWTYSHLFWRLGQALDDATIEPVDSALLRFLRRTPWDDEYDLIGGLVGYGVYALEQEAHVRDQLLDLVVARLAETSARRDGGATWLTPPSRLPSQQLNLAPDGYFNLGVAHGVPGVIALLGGAVQAGQRSRWLTGKPVMAGYARAAAGLLTDAVGWLREQRHAGESPWAFPLWVAPGSGSPPSRLAWCYGDAGLAVAWLVAARAAGREDWDQEALAVARGAAARTVESGGVVEAGLCHGAAGVAHIFNRLFQATEDEMFRETARQWFERALDMGPDCLADAGFLVGKAGLALALLAACTDVEPEWDRALLLDVPAAQLRATSESL